MASFGSGSIAQRWRELHGEHSWDGLLDPLDIDLRKSIISYGELAQAAGEAFNSEKRSPHAGLCRYGYSNLLTMSTVAAPSNYEVTKFVYATAAERSQRDAFLVRPDAALIKRQDAPPMESNWMGYVAVATEEGVAALGRRDIVVAWRGTVTQKEWNNNFDIMTVSAAPVLGSASGEHPSAKLHRGFLSLYTSSNADSELNKCSAGDQVLAEVRRLMELYKDEATSITITGHSLGASLSILNAVDIVANGVNAPANSSSSSQAPPCPVTAILFASPAVGNDSFSRAFLSFPGLRALHVKNANDWITALHLGMKEYYSDVPAVPLPINTGLSPYLKDPNMVTAHNLECYLHGVAGYQGSAGGFNLEVERDVALVNKTADALKDEHPVPVSWWVLQYKSMAKNAQGKWELKDFEQIRPHQPGHSCVI